MLAPRSCRVMCQILVHRLGSRQLDQASEGDVGYRAGRKREGGGAQQEWMMTAAKGSETHIDGANKVFGPHEDVGHGETEDDGADPRADKALNCFLGR